MRISVLFVVVFLMLGSSGFAGSYANHHPMILNYEKTGLSTTVSLDSSMTTQEIQDEIDKCDKYIPRDGCLIFQFADGTYTLTNTLSFEGFYGGGTLCIYGNTGEANATSLHTTQSVIIDASTYSGWALTIRQNATCVSIRNLRVKCDDSNYSAALAVYGCLPVLAHYCYFEGEGTSATDTAGVICYWSIMEIYKSYFSANKMGIYCQGSRIYSSTNDDTGTQPLYGLYANQAGTIGKAVSQPDGSIADEYTFAGGEIR